MTAPSWRSHSIKSLMVLALLLVASSAFAQDAVAPAADAGSETLMWTVWGVTAPLGAIVGLIAAMQFYFYVKRRDPGDANMVKIADAVRKGAYAYLRRQYKVVAIVFVVLSLLLAWMAWGLHVQSKLVPFAFLTGGIFSGICGYIGMKTATMASSRTAQAAKQSLNSGLQVAFRAGAVMGLVVVGFGLLDICLWFAALYWLAPWLNPSWKMTLEQVTVTMLCFGMGASTQALFARLGGGIFTKAADVGADLVGKVEAGIPEDDPRNPATIADNVGDNVGDVAGMGADLYESYCGSILATAALGVAAAGAAASTFEKLAFITLPMAIAGIGTIISVLGCFLVRAKEDASQKNLLSALNRGIWGAGFGILIVSAFIVLFFLKGPLGTAGALGVWGAIAAGLVSGLVIGRATEYYTSGAYKPTQELADKALTGPATVIIDGYALGLRSTGIPVLAISAAIILAFGLAGGFGGHAQAVQLGLYGVGIAAVGMLATLGITLATDAYGPIADNAGGNAEMTHQDPSVRVRTDALDSLGNTTAATGKGFAIGSAALTALTLLAAYVEEVRIGVQREATACVAQAPKDAAADALIPMGHGKFAGLKMDEESGMNEAYIAVRGDHAEKRKVAGQEAEVSVVRVKNASMADFMAYYDVTLMNPRVLCGLMIGAMLTFLFSSMAMRAVGRAAVSMVNEVRRQFKAFPGIMKGTEEPDYAACVDISTRGAQREMVLPSLMAIVAPVAVGLVLDVSGVLGLLAGALAAGFVLAVAMANSGGAWDNAKKYIEGGAHGGKRSDAHKAAVVGDTVGDPFKDTAGPVLNILIKLMSMVAVVVAGVTVKFGPIIGDWFAKLSMTK